MYCALRRLSFVACLLSFGCGSSDSTPSDGAGGSGAGGQSAGGSSGSGGASSAALALTSTVFHEGETIPAEYRCAAPSPDLAWSGGPSDAKSYAVVFKDVTPGISNGFLHWILFDVPAATHALDKGVPIGYAPATPAGAHQAPIWNGTQGFNGPCGGMNTYELTLHALDAAPLPDVTMSTAGAAAVTSIEAHSVAQTTMTVKSQP